VREKELLTLEQEKRNISQRNIRNSIIAGFAGLMIFLLVVYRVVSLRKQKNYLQATVAKRTEQLSISLTEKEALLKEIHHRVKNNLEVISSLLMLQTNSVKDQQAKDSLTEGQSRIQSIALIHHKLYRNDDLGSVELKEFTVDLFKQVKDVFNKPGNQVALSFNGDGCWLSTDKAVPLGLILNELFTNAFKYAVRPGIENRITITLNENMPDNASGFSLIYSDNGPGMPEGFDPRKSASLGMKVIHLLTRQLEGSLNIYNNNGTIVEMQFPNK
jgi:two-component sensor histidine kinase